MEITSKLKSTALISVPFGILLGRPDIFTLMTIGFYVFVIIGVAVVAGAVSCKRYNAGITISAVTIVFAFTFGCTALISSVIQIRIKNSTAVYVVERLNQFKTTNGHFPNDLQGLNDLFIWGNYGYKPDLTNQNFTLFYSTNGLTNRTYSSETQQWREFGLD